MHPLPWAAEGYDSFIQTMQLFFISILLSGGNEQCPFGGSASGRPVIAADRAGCRETLDDGVTGFLVPVNDEKAVIEATEKILRMSSEERKAMGLRGSEKIRREFDRKLVVEAYWEEIEAIQGSK